MADQQAVSTVDVEALQRELEEVKAQLKEATEDKEKKKIVEVVDAKLDEFKKENFERNLEGAHEIFKQATENEKLAFQERNEKVYMLRDAQIARERQNLIDHIKQVKHMIQTEQYPQNFFSSTNTNELVAKYRDFYYRLCTDTRSVEEFVDDFIERQKRPEYGF